MAELLDIIQTMPSAIFTAMLGFAVAFWLLSIAVGGGAGNLDVDAELELDSGDIDLGDESSLSSALKLDQIPISLSFTIFSAASWLVSVIATHYIDNMTTMTSVVTLIIAGGALVGGLAATSLLARPLAPLFAANPGIHHRDLIGRECIIRTGRVDASFGQGEVRDREFGSHLVQVRCMQPNDLTAGSVTLVVDVEDGVFMVSDEPIDF